MTLLCVKPMVKQTHRQSLDRSCYCDTHVTKPIWICQFLQVWPIRRNKPLQGGVVRTHGKEIGSKVILDLAFKPHWSLLALMDNSHTTRLFLVSRFNSERISFLVSSEGSTAAFVSFRSPPEPSGAPLVCKLQAPQCSFFLTHHHRDLHADLRCYAMILRTQPWHQGTLTQPLQCDLTHCRTQRRNQSRLDRPQPQSPHTRGTFHRQLQHAKHIKDNKNRNA